MDSNKSGEPEAPYDIAGPVNATVSDRLNLLKPVLQAQATHGLTQGRDCHSAAGLVPHESVVRASVAKHAGFDNPKLISEMSKKEVRAVQRGATRNKRLTTPSSDGMDLTGQWVSTDKTNFLVHSSNLGLLDSSSDSSDRFTALKTTSNFGKVELEYNGWNGHVHGESIRWHRFEREFKDGQYITTDQRKELSWHRPGTTEGLALSDRTVAGAAPAD